MVDSPNFDEPISQRRSKRSCRLSIVKSEPGIEKKAVQPIVDNNEIDEEEDPADLFQLGDIFWVRVAGNPWWPALIYGSYYEEYIHTKVIKIVRRRKRRRYFVYFFGPDFEYTWSDASSLIPYSGLEEFIRQAETSVQKAVTKSEQEALANRFELKVAASKRRHWEKSIEEADQSLKLPREKRLENFAEMLKNLLNKSQEIKRSSIPTRQSVKKTLSPSAVKSSNRSSVKRQKTKSTPVSTSTTLLHVGLPTLTKKEEKQIINGLLDHDQLTFNEAQSFACQLAIDIIKENFDYEMSCVQIEWFYDFLLNHPEIVYKYSHWFNEDIKPVIDDSIYFKQCQLKNMIQKK